jgi:hypothetical protein
LRLAQLFVGVVEAVLGGDQPRQFFDRRAHRAILPRVSSPGWTNDTSRVSL